MLHCSATVEQPTSKLIIITFQSQLGPFVLAFVGQKGAMFKVSSGQRPNLARRLVKGTCCYLFTHAESVEVAERIFFHANPSPSVWVGLVHAESRINKKVHIITTTSPTTTTTRVKGPINKPRANRTRNRGGISCRGAGCFK